ncbi:MAG: hypothetical protein DRI40_04165 [Chloroflexi bacterium]|nr:MAG: hypothetical protein DRI40_04165 [Chloroflexota bacterium]
MARWLQPADPAGVCRSVHSPVFTDAEAGSGVGGGAKSDLTSSRRSIVAITVWEWDFDNDGTADSTERNPSWPWSSPRTYTVLLKVTEPGGSHTKVKTDFITIEEQAEEDGTDDTNGEAGVCTCASVARDVSASGLLVGWAIVGLCLGSGYWVACGGAEDIYRGSRLCPTQHPGWRDGLPWYLTPGKRPVPGDAD